MRAGRSGRPLAGGEGEHAVDGRGGALAAEAPAALGELMVEGETFEVGATDHDGDEATGGRGGGHSGGRACRAGGAPRVSW